MISEWFLTLMEGVVTWFMSLFEPIELPDWVSSPPADIASFMVNLDSVGVWVPWPIVTTVTLGVVTVYVVLFVVKIVKQVLAHVPAIGGAG